MQEEQPGRWSRLFRVGRWIFGPAALVFLAIAGWQSRDAFSTILDDANPVRLLAAIALTGCLHLLSPVVTWRILRELGPDVSYGTLMRIHVHRLPARYLPGGIWHTVSRAVESAVSVWIARNSRPC